MISKKKWYGSLQKKYIVYDMVYMEPSQKKYWLKSMASSTLGLTKPFETKVALKAFIKKHGILGDTYGMKPIIRVRDSSRYRSVRKNPPVPRDATEIYDNIYSIEAKKGSRSLWPKENFRHDFTKKGTKIYGLRDGSLLIKGRQRLWKQHKYDERDIA